MEEEEEEEESGLTDHIDEFLEGDGAVAIAELPLLLQLLDLVRMNLAAEFRRFQNGAKVVPRNLSESFRIELSIENSINLINSIPMNVTFMSL